MSVCVNQYGVLCYNLYMSRTLLERITASMVVVLLTTLSLGFILTVANLIFEWDLFTPSTEKILYFLMVAALVIILSATLINIMLNLSRLAHFSKKIAEKMLEE